MAVDQMPGRLVHDDLLHEPNLFEDARKRLLLVCRVHTPIMRIGE